MKARYSQFAKLSETEQATAASASGDVLQVLHILRCVKIVGSQLAKLLSLSPMLLQELKSCNEAYEAKFGHIFIVCATGKSAAEMLGLVKARQAGIRVQHIVNNGQQDDMLLTPGAANQRVWTRAG